MMQFRVLYMGRVIAHVTGESREEALRDFGMSRRAGWYPATSELGEVGSTWNAAERPTYGGRS